MIKSLLILLLFVGAMPRLWGIDGGSLRYFVRQSIRISANADKSARTREFKQLLKDNDQLILFLAKGNDFLQQWQEAKLPPLPGNLESIFQLNQLWSHSLLGKFRSSMVTGMFKLFGNRSLNATIDLIPTASINAICQMINQNIDQTPFSDQELIEFLSVGPFLNRVLQGLSSDLQQQVFKVAASFMQKMSLKEKRFFILDYLQLSIGAPPEQTIQTIVKHSGPVVQSLLRLSGQLFSQKELNQTAKRLENQLPTTVGEQELAIKEIENALPHQKKMAEVFSAVSFLSAGIFNLTFQGRLLADGREVVIKVNRPEIRQRFSEDIAILKKHIELPSFLTLLATLENSFHQEVNFQQEMAYTTEAARYYQMDPKITVAETIDILTSNRHVMFLEKAKGQSINYTTPSELTHSALQRLAKAWLTRALFGDGYFHGNLHGGNIFFAATPDAPDNYLLTLLDYGSTEYFSQGNQETFVHFILALGLNNPLQVRKTLQKLLNTDAETIASIEHELLPQLMNPKASLSAVIQTLHSFLSHSDLAAPSNLMMFFRSWVYLEGLLAPTYHTISFDVAKSKMAPLLVKVLLKQGFLLNKSRFWPAFSACLFLRAKGTD